MYWGIPPEVNAFRLTRMGVGAGAHAGQIAGFAAASATHVEQATQQAVTAVATSAVFEGSGGVQMLASAMPFSAWLAAAGAHAANAAATIQAGVDAYAVAVAATIPHEVVVANRVREATLEATNILGQNTPAIAEANAEYAEFWGQNAGAMVGYLTVVTGLLGSLSVPLPPMPQASNPGGVLPALAGIGAQAVGLGAQAVSTGLSMGASAGVGGIAAGIATPIALGTGIGLPAAPPPPQPAPGSSGPAPAPGVAPQPIAPPHPGTVGPPQPGAVGPPAPQSAQADLMQAAQPMMGTLTSAPSMLSSAISSPLSQIQQIPSALTGQMGGLMGPLSSLTGGMSGLPGMGSGPPGLSAAGSPWSGLSGANGGFAGGGSAVAASLTKPSAGAGAMGGPVTLPDGWWATQPDAAQPAVAGLRNTASAGGAAMGPGIVGPMGAASASRRGAEHADVAEADKTITVAATAHQVPVLTADGVVYTGGQGG
uniref:Putative PPE family protein PPE36 n=1 Tax=Mycobacterium riyadhense TaxID=486698 RepID=A0A653EY17_9MYCO|nr:putative PPE family protein PPE36 [Mycobacterium riyadhense]